MFQAAFLQFIFVALVVAVKVTTAQQSSQVQARVYEKVDRFMSVPVTELETFADYFNLGGFPNDLHPRDKEVAIKYMYSLINGLEEAGIKPFYGFEDGLLLGYWHTSHDMFPVFVYREPGESGYLKDDEDFGIYWNTCVNSETGDEEPCLIKEGERYVSCVDNCTLIPCPDSASQRDCSVLEMEQQQEDCESNIKWCRNYNILPYEADSSSSSQQRGFVPTNDYCINEEGEPSQAKGEVLTVTAEGAVVLGDCKYESGALVERSLSGPFADCANDPSGVCNTTYAGGYLSYNYDPRWRTWFVESRAAQRPLFSDPYIFFIIQTPGITYTHPIYQRDHQGRNVFVGTVAFDMELTDISDFLINSFNDTEYQVAVYEDEEPHYMIGVSTGSSVVALALKNDTSQICTEEQVENEECAPIHSTIHTFGSTSEGILLLKAHNALEENSIDDVSIRETEEVDSPAYTATSVIYEQPGRNLKWRIVVVARLGEDPDDAITQGEGVFILVCIIGVLGFVLCFTLLVLFYQRRHEQAVQFADVSFTSAFILGCSLLNLSTLAQLGENTDELCLLRMWMFFLLSSMCLSPLFVKAFRTWKLLGSPASSALNVKMNNFQAFLRSLPIPILQTIILLIFTFVDPPLATETIDWDSRPVLKGETCEYETDAFYITQGLFDLVLIIAGCILAYLTRNIDPRFGDAKALLFAMYNIAFTCLMLVIIFSTVNISSSGSRVLQAIGVFWATVFSSAAFIVPRLIAAKEERRRISQERMTARKSMMPRIVKFSRMSTKLSTIHDSDESLKILVCSANIGNAEPTLSSMRAWVPEEGRCAGVKPLDEAEINAERFHMIVIGMQEATWGSKKKKEGQNANASASVEMGYASDDSQEGQEDDGLGNSKRNSEKSERKTGESKEDREMAKEDAFMASVQGEDTVALRKMLRSLLGDDYKSVAEEIRGQMRLHIYALKEIAPYIEDLKVSGANTGIGNVLANKGGIVISMNCMDTRFTFLSAHLAAHEGENYYKNRCDNVYDILRSSKTFDLSQKFHLDLAISSHHMFVLGDLNFRTKFEGENEHSENVKRALELVKAEDWSSLYSFDELHKGVKDGHLLVKFKTLPCNFHPTFKVNRKEGFDYKEQRTPSYTDRILFKSSQNLHGNLMPLAYEPCVDFITSDHKPVRGAFSLIPNDVIEPTTLQGKFRLAFSEMECSDLLAGDVDGSSDPYVKFIWDSVAMTEDKLQFTWGRSKWPSTTYKSKNLNPKWKEKIVLVTTGESINTQSMLYVTVYDYDVLSEDDILGTLPLSIHELISMADQESSKEVCFDEPLERFGKFGGRIKFKLEVSVLIG